jgi:hypothetical protein|tara:strand:+ start:417 stop:608 length:192 start_codon:yes stop_codon:yes gene_type:complete
MKMNCFYCKDTELVWGGDHEADRSTVYSMVTNLTCPKCSALVLIYSGVEAEEPPARIVFDDEA